MSSRLFSRERKTSLLRRFSLFSFGLTYTAGDLRLINLLDLIYLPLLSSFPLSALPHRGGTLPQPLGSFTAATSTGSSEAEIEVSTSDNNGSVCELRLTGGGCQTFADTHNKTGPCSVRLVN